jgi:ankyrin repeat protein
VRGALQGTSSFAPLPAKFSGREVTLQFRCDYNPSRGEANGLGAAVSSKDDLHAAARPGDKAKAQPLPKKNRDFVSSKGRTPLHIAALKDSNDEAKSLLAEGADVNAKEASDGRTPLHIAALNGSKDVAGLLLAKGAEVNAKDKYGETPLHLAALRKDCKDVVELLRQHGGHE